MSGTIAVRRRLGRWAALGLAVVGLAALASAAWWRWARAAEPTPGPTDAALAEADPEVAAAVRMAREHVLHEPRSVAAWGLLGQVLLANGFAADADACLARAEALDPDDPHWPYLRAYGCSPDSSVAFAAAGRAVAACQRTGKIEAGPYLILAELSVERGDREQPDVLCRHVLDREPGNPRAHLDRGLIALADNDPGAAIPHLLRAAESPATRRTAYTQLAAAYQRCGETTQAKDYARRARLAPPDQGWTDPYVERMQEFATGPAAPPPGGTAPGPGPLEGGHRVAPADDGRQPVRRSRLRRSWLRPDPGRGLRGRGAGVGQGGGPRPGFRGAGVSPRGGALQAGGTARAGRRPGFGRREVPGGRRRRPPRR